MHVHDFVSNVYIRVTLQCFVYCMCVCLCACLRVSANEGVVEGGHIGVF